MKKLLLLSFLFAPLSLSAQEVTAAEDQGTTSMIILALVTGQPIEYNAQTYKLTYTTVDALGQPTTASGIVCVPDNADLVYPLAVYNHATIDRPEDVISVVGVRERFIPQAFAGKGIITFAPDYLGYGENEGFHPYFHAASQATAGRDLLIAGRAWLEEQAIAFNQQVFVTGYSQGAHASMSLQKLLDQTEDGPSVTAAAHLSGSYIVRPPSPQFLAISEPNAATLRFALNQIIAYEFVYNLYGGVDGLFKEPYLAEVQRYVSEDIDLERLGVVVDSLIRDNNTVIGDIFVDQYVTDVLDMDPDLFTAYSENTVLNFGPSAPTLLFACPGDEVVNPVNSELAQDSLEAYGAEQVTLVLGPENNHLDCAPVAGVAAINYFLQFADIYPVSLGEANLHSEVSLSPNPVTAGRELTVAGVEGNRPYVIYDLSGRQLINGVTSAGGGINLPASLPRGTNVVRVGLAGGTSVVRRIVVR